LKLNPWIECSKKPSPREIKLTQSVRPSIKKTNPSHSFIASNNGGGAGGGVLQSLSIQQTHYQPNAIVIAKHCTNLKCAV
jgi:hypothetical protein